MVESKLIHNLHNVSVLVYHFLFPKKYQRVVIDKTVDDKLRQICDGIELRYDWIRFLEIGLDKDHIHFLVQSNPNYAPSKIVTTIKSITQDKYLPSVLKLRSNYGVGSFGAMDIL